MSIINEAGVSSVRDCSDVWRSFLRHAVTVGRISLHGVWGVMIKTKMNGLLKKDYENNL